MVRQSIAIVGFGDLGQRLCGLLSPAQWRRYGLRRNVSAVPAGVEGVAVDLQQSQSLRVLAGIRPEVLVVTLTPSERSPGGYARGFDHAMQAIIEGLDGHQPRQAFFVSSTRVYAESAGGWVDENAELARDDPFAGAIIRAEDRLLEALPGAIVLRAAGLYGSAPGYLLKRVTAGRLTPREPLRFSNRVHRDDVAGFIAYRISCGISAHAPNRALNQRIINLVDQAPAPVQETEAWMCEQLGQSYNPEDRDSSAQPASHKRILSTGLAASDYNLQYPDYRAGYAPVLREWLAHSER